MGILSRTKKELQRLKRKGFILADYADKTSEYFFGPYGRNSNPLGRLVELSDRNQYNHDKGSCLQTPGRIAIFAAFSNRLGASTKAYLQALNQAGFAVVYINNSTTLKSEIPIILKLTWRALDRVNIGRDIGAYKDGILLLESEGHLDKCELLGIFNDSTTFIPGKNTDELARKINSFSESPCKGLFSHASTDVKPHYQSFFQILKPEIFRSNRFLSFWRSYRHISHRGHSIYNGEIALSTKVYNYFKPNMILYSSESLIEHLSELQEAGDAPFYSELLELLPSISRSLDSGAPGYSLRCILEHKDKELRISKLDLYRVAELIENSNPSHMAAFLYPLYLRCPLVKNDLCSAGTYSLAQAVSLLSKALNNSVNTDDDAKQARLILEEYIQVINSKGTPRSYISNTRNASIKGITSGFVYPKFNE
jgi:hypothetical protein